MNNNPIGILDSGVGGLSIRRAVRRELPNESTIYIADSKNIPYGTKSAEQIHSLSKRMVKFLLEKQVKLIVVACNTISVLCLEYLRKDFPQISIIGIVPVIKTAVKASKNKKIGILSTSATAKSSYQQHLIQQFSGDCKVITVGTDSLVPFVERGEIYSSQLEAVLVGELSPFVRQNVDTVALGCSHFPFLRKSIQQVLGDTVLLLDSGDAVARQTKRVLEAQRALASVNNSTQKIFTTGKNINTFLELDDTIAENDIQKVDL